jgi:hypothetical protein
MGIIGIERVDRSIHTWTFALCREGSAQRNTRILAEML